MPLFGCVFSLFSRKPRDRSVFADGYFWHGVVFISIFNVMVLYGALRFPGWMWMYFTDKTQHSFLELGYLFLFLYYLPYTLGYYIGRDLKGLSVFFNLLFILAMASIEAFLISKLFDRYSHVGTLIEFQTGQASSLFSSETPLKNLANTCIGVMIGYFIFVVYHRRRKKHLFHNTLR